MSDLKILFKYASRSRVENFARGLKSIVENCESQNFHILVSVDTDDKEMENSKSLSSKKLRLCGFQLPENTILLLEKYAKKTNKPKQVVVNEAIINHTTK